MSLIVRLTDPRLCFDDSPRHISDFGVSLRHETVSNRRPLPYHFSPLFNTFRVDRAYPQASQRACRLPSSWLLAKPVERDPAVPVVAPSAQPSSFKRTRHFHVSTENFDKHELCNLRTLLSGDPVPARKEMLKHVSEIRMMPQVGKGDEKPHYAAEGNWNLLGSEEVKFARDAASRQIRVDAGA